MKKIDITNAMMYLYKLIVTKENQVCELQDKQEFEKASEINVELNYLYTLKDYVMLSFIKNGIKVKRSRK